MTDGEALLTHICYFMAKLQFDGLSIHCQPIDMPAIAVLAWFEPSVQRDLNYSCRKHTTGGFLAMFMNEVLILVSSLHATDQVAC